MDATPPPPVENHPSTPDGDFLPLPDAPVAPTSSARVVFGALGGVAFGAGLTFGGIEAAEALAIDWRALFPEGAGVGRWLIGALLLLVAFWLQVLLHEAGHALAGLAGGLRPLAFGVGPLRLERAGDGWRFRWGGGVAGISGFAALLPPADGSPSRGVQAAYLLGGVIANAVVAGLALWALTASPPEVSRGLLVALAATGLFLAVVNLIPFGSGGWLSDGAGLWSLWRQPGLAFASITLQQVLQASMDGVRPRDWPAALLPADDAPFGEYGDPALDTGIAVMRLSRALDAGDAVRAEAAARFLHATWPTASAPLRPGVAATLAVHCLLVHQDLVAVRACRERMVGSLLDMGCHEAWLDAEIAWGDGDVAQARAKLDEAVAALPRVHDAGTREIVAEYLEAFQARLAAHESAIFPPRTEPG
ncbi:MAG: hypothetical protein ACK5VV_01805 [Lysobacteraceae bacterium]